MTGPLSRAVAVGSLLALVGCASRPGVVASTEPPPLNVQLLAFNDFHGSLEPPSGSNGRIGEVEAGGIEYLATHLARLKADNANTIVVSAGDNIGASPLISGMFHDEPTIEGLAAAGLQVSTVGNHEFDEGWWELYRMQKGGCHPVDGCQDTTPFAGAPFEFLSANVILDPQRVDPAALRTSGWRASAPGPQTLFPAYTIRNVGGVKVGFIGLVLRGAVEIVSPTAWKGLTFGPEAEAANNAAVALVRQGVRAIVVLIHEGGTQAATGTYNSCDGLTGPIVGIAGQLSDDIDVIVSGHTHQAYNCTLGKKLVTSASSFGRIVTDIDMRVDRTTGEVVSKTARNLIVTRDVPPSVAESAILEHYRPLYSVLGARMVGTIARELTRVPNAAGESPLGDVVADAFLEATRTAAGGGAVAAFVNSGGIRSDLTGLPPAAANGSRAVSYAQVFEVQPFGNRAIVKTLTGDTLRRVLEQQFDNPSDGRRVILQVSSGVSYSYDLARPKGQRIDPASLMIDGHLLDAAARYRVTFTDFVWNGGDGFTLLSEGTDAIAGDLDVDILSAYIQKHSPISPGPQNRIQRRP